MKCLGMKPGNITAILARSTMLCTAALLIAQPGAMASTDDRPSAQAPSKVTLDGETRAEGIREWIEIAEPGNLGLLMMGIAGLLIGRWAARNKRKGPPDR